MGTGDGVQYEAYERLELLGSGGNADVHRARAPDGSEVALKTPQVPDRDTVDASFFEAFSDEAEVWDRLDGHDHVVGVYDYGRAHLPWLALEYVPDGSLGAALPDLDRTERLSVLLDVCNAVFHAHRHGVSHGDLKPENVLLDRSNGLTAKVADWGLATVLLEHTGSADGATVAYAAPEQLDPDEFGGTDDRTDIYQLGAIAYELLADRPPFDHDSTPAAMAAVLHDEPTPPSDLAAVPVPGELETAVHRALSKEKADRQESVVYLRDAVAEALDGIGGGDTTEKRSTSAAAGAADRTSDAAASSSDPHGGTTSREEPGACGEPGKRSMTPAEALAGTNLFVRYRGPTLDDLDAGVGREALDENLRLEHHTTFDAEAVTIDGRRFDAFLARTQVYRFVEWLVTGLPLEVRNADAREALGDLYRAIPELDRVALDETAGGRSFDLVGRDRLGNKLVVATLSDTPMDGGTLTDLVRDATAVAEGAESLVAAMAVTDAFFEPAALKTTADATAGGLLSRDKREGFVNLSREQGYHLCLVQGRDRSFRLSVPEL